MSHYQYKYPPVEEAVCEFRFAPVQAWNIAMPWLIYDKIKDDYKGVPEQQNLIQLGIQLTGQAPANPNFPVRQDPFRVIFKSEKATKLVGVSSESLSIHTLRPYEGWEEFKQRIDKSYQTYLEVTQASAIKSIAIRYINQIFVSTDQTIHLDEYFTVHPSLPNGVSGKVSGFIHRTRSIYEDIPVTLTVTLSDAPAPHGQSAFILDLEVIQEWIENPLAVDAALTVLDELKQRETQVFESLITDRTRELFNVVE